MYYLEKSVEKNSKRLALVLEGGGARGAYQAGVLKALFEAGYKFDGVAGTSVGALNGAMVAQNKFEDSLKIWNEIDFENVLGINNMYGENLANKSFDQDTIKYFYNYVKKLIGQRGLDTTKIKNLIKANIDEDILRNSGVDFGIMTYSLTEKQPLSIFVEDMPYGQVADYVMASASFPGFKKTVVEGQEYIDGGIYDNMPVNMMLDRGYKDVVAIETKSSIPKRKPKDKDCQIYYIRPSEKPGRVMNFAGQSTERAVQIGYMDALKLLRGYVGKSYFIDVKGKSPFGYSLCDFDDSLYAEIATAFGEVYLGQIELTEVLCKELKLNGKNFAECAISIYEKIAAVEGLERLKVYRLDDFMANVFENLYKVPTDVGSKIFREIKIVMIISNYLRNNKK